jgi:D-serine deaminase-like pyridoxal phosphate-dependent protein
MALGFSGQVVGAGDHERLERACAELEPPFAVVDIDAFAENADTLARRAGGKSIRIASKSLRCRALLERLLADEKGAFNGVLALTVAEALWLADHRVRDIVVGYPSVDREALSAVMSRVSSGTPDERITLMVDAIEHLELLDSLGGEANVCVEADAGLWLLGGRVRVGPRRSPLHTPAHLAAFAAEIKRRPALALVGMMAYEGQIAGVGDHPAGRPLRGLAIQAMQAASRRELRSRRKELVAAVEGVVGELSFVNAGGTGSLESSSSEPWVSELTAGSGLFGPALFDDYTRFRPRPAAFYTLPIVRRPGPGVVTALGGGYVASGPAGPDRLPRPWWPTGLKLDPQEGAGETQTPLRGAIANALRIGDRVWMRHAKAGELCERFQRLYLVSGDRIVDEVPTYRGEGQCFL